MHRNALRASSLALITLVTTGASAAQPRYPFAWTTVVNNGDTMPGAPTKTFNSYNQPSVNANQLVVFRARSRGGQGGQPAHGVYARNMALLGVATKILDRATPVPDPNNRGTTFIEPPSFPRIDIAHDTIATRGNHPPVWKVTGADGEVLEQLGTTGIYGNPNGPLITGASKLGSVEQFSYFEVPEAPGTPFDVFPGAPAVVDRSTIVFKGNYTVDGAGKTGVYYRDLTGSGSPVVLIANNTSTFIPGTTTLFGSTAPPSAASGQAVFAGFDNEANPTAGGIYLAPLSGTTPPLRTLVSIGQRVPGESSAKFNRLGEGVSFDGRFVAFWGAWGTETRMLRLWCGAEGNRDRVDFCWEQHPSGFDVQVPIHQGIFVHDTRTGQTRAVAKTPDDFSDFVFWNFSGRVPGTGEGDDDGELARWRSTAFVAVSGRVDNSLTDATFHAAFKARTGQVVNGTYPAPIDGIYLRQGPGQAAIRALVETGMDGTLLDPEAVDPLGSHMPVTETGIERDGFRGNSLVVNASMGTEEAGWAGIYLTEIRE
jgi:hypothetical protein